MNRNFSVRKWLRLDLLWDRLFSWSDTRRGQRARPSAFQRLKVRPFFDQLEERLVPTCVSSTLISSSSAPKTL